MSSVGFMLVHGGGHDGRCWSRLQPHLDGPSLAVDLPGRGSHPGDLSDLSISDFVESAVADLDAFDEAERVVLVGHSMAGVTIPGVATSRPGRIAHLAFVSCFVPREGGAITGEMPALLQLISRFASRRPARSTMSPRTATYMFCNGMTDEQRDFTLSVLVPEVRGIPFERVSREGFPSAEAIPRTFVKLLKDRALRPKLQDRLMANLGQGHVRTLSTCHDAMISKPKELASILNEIKAGST